MLNLDIYDVTKSILRNINKSIDISPYIQPLLETHIIPNKDTATLATLLKALPEEINLDLKPFNNWAAGRSMVEAHNEKNFEKISKAIAKNRNDLIEEHGEDYWHNEKSDVDSVLRFNGIMPKTRPAPQQKRTPITTEKQEEINRLVSEKLEKRDLNTSSLIRKLADSSRGEIDPKKPSNDKTK